MKRAIHWGSQPASAGGGILRHSSWDGLLVGLALAHGVFLFVAPFFWAIAFGVWWTSNTIAHNFIHLPFFRSRGANRCFAIYLSALTGIPQSLWKERHLAHHGGYPWRLRVTRQLALETSAVALVWGALAYLAGRFFFETYLPAFLLGLGLCWLHGHYEHARGTTSHYGTCYNWLFFNDGYHVEHHARPSTHWRSLRRNAASSAPASRWPAVLRWLEIFSLESLERIVLRIPFLQRWVLRSHQRAFARLLPNLSAPREIGIVGGALFPRTALILQKLIPNARLTIIDLDAGHMRAARPFVEGVEFLHARFEASDPNSFDLVVIPLSFRGDRHLLYEHPPAPALLIHDWLWRGWPASATISTLLLKRLNLVQAASFQSGAK
jgi:hypothetical protein